MKTITECPKCSYLNDREATFCQLCGHDFSSHPSKDNLEYSTNIKQAEIEKAVSSRQQEKTSLLSQLKQISLFQNKSFQSRIVNYKNWEILKLKNISGIAVICIFVILFWWREFDSENSNAVTQQETIEINIELLDSIEEVHPVPRGIFSYTGEGYFAALLKSGLLKETTANFPNFEAKYVLPTNQDNSYSVAIEMLLEGKVDWVFNGRPLTPEEYAKSSLRNIELKEVAIARDGIAFYVNPELSVDKITIEQLIDIFAGRISNWQQLGGENLAIVPVILSEENIESLGFKINSSKANIRSNHTLAVREVINTPGAIGYSSASLIKNQKLLKFLRLGKTNSSNNKIEYVAPFERNRLNKEAFENGTYPLVRRLYIAYSDRPNSQAVGTAISSIILSHQGQDIVERSGFIPLRGD